MSEYNSLEIDKLAFFEANIDDWTRISNNDNLRVLVSLLDSKTFFGDLFVASIYTLRKPDNTVLFSYL